MLQPTTIELDGKVYTLGKFPATVGREILTQYPTTALPKIGDYKTNHALMLRVMSYIGVTREGHAEPLMLNTEALVNNHVDGAETLMRLEWAMMTHNFQSLGNGAGSDFLGALVERVQGLIMQMLMGLSQQSSEKN